MALLTNSPRSKPLTVFGLVMINVIAVDSLRSLTVGAEYGFALLFFYALAALLFFIPTILVTAELATGWPNTGGVYIWVREAFGPHWGFLTIWLQWIYNVVWYPTIFVFIAGILAYLIQPQLVDNKIFMLSVILIAFWGATILNCLGIKVTAWISIIGAILGTLFPMILITLLGLFWIYSNPLPAASYSLTNFFPKDWSNLAFITNILFGLMGMEMSAVHAGDVGHPKKDYPRALLYSGMIILLTLVLACLAITIVIPIDRLNLVSGLMDAFTIFFNAFHLGWFIPIIAVLIILGCLSGAAAWIVGPARGLYVATADNDLPKFLSKVNQKNMPVGILITQGIIVTVLCTVFFIMPNVNSTYWVLSNLTAQLALLFYVLMFAAAIRLRYKFPNIDRAYKIPGGKLGIGLVAGIGMLTCLVAIVIGFIPPTNISLGNIICYEAILILGMIIFCVTPFFLRTKRKNF
jgi:amino acid transporter